jgi:5-methylthioadenosine/S-adenosylhomocysteine deaminase
MPGLLVRNGLVLTLDDHLHIVSGDVAAQDGRIVAVGPDAARAIPAPDTVLDARGGYVLPGLVQTHVHLCQTIFRGAADDLALLDWLRRRVWPLEAAHDPASLRASTRLASAELLLSGTTTVLTMETVHDTDAVLEALEETGLRATVGKCLMDADAGDVPARLREPTGRAIDESLALRRRWNGAAGGRLRVAFAPRFAVSCTRELLEAVAALSGSEDALVHTHASEQREEVELVRRLTGQRNMAYLAATGLASPRLCAAHCIWVDESEQALMAEHDVKVLHCPSSNFKLGSGIAPVPEMRARGITVSLGADGAACSNRLDMFDEMRLAATMQAVRVGPGALPAREVVWMATRDGARTLGLDGDIGSVEPGKRADLVVVEAERVHTAPGGDPYSTLVYACRGSDVRHVVVDGRVLVRDFDLVHMDRLEVVASSRAEAAKLAARAGL